MHLRGLDKAVALLVVYNDSGSTNESFRVTVDKSKDRLVAGVYAFLERNAVLLSTWIKLLRQCPCVLALRGCALLLLGCSPVAISLTF